MKQQSLPFKPVDPNTGPFTPAKDEKSPTGDVYGHLTPLLRACKAKLMRPPGSPSLVVWSPLQRAGIRSLPFVMVSATVWPPHSFVLASPDLAEVPFNPSKAVPLPEPVGDVLGSPAEAVPILS